MKKILLLVYIIFCVVALNAQNALSFDGVNDYVSVPDGGGVNNLQTGTIEMWVKWVGTTQDLGYSGAYGAVLARQNNSDFSNQIIALNGANPNSANVIWRPYYSGSTKTVLTSSVSPGENTWIHLAITYSSGSHIMYINGAQVATSASTGSVADNISVPLTIGAWVGDGGSYSCSVIDEVRIWSDIRTQTEISNNMNIELVGNEENLVTYFNFNEGNAGGDNESVTTATELVSGNNGVLINFDLSGSTSNWVNDNDYITSSNESVKNIPLSVFPNPFKNYIQVKGFIGEKMYTICNLSGSDVKKGLVSESQNINVEELSNGIYILKVYGENPVKLVKR
ncbi:LamG-like jellyroll fold domain-containing protein [Plebeiibacterium marinum]|uniref:T9SS type A sorting domain-containing protein n=1 Tax=Plebeiibacterium marinum TaxID=2992111 RepID=A0AAE3MHE4_9BACT|nr:LamG-like jellyroll fold domain-containing protein [Plebeiobacterium marinum]MCW3807776.1 T9SS type A sorting domain-containing protein [Plebeiobacterium marinum]